MCGGSEAGSYLRLKVNCMKRSRVLMKGWDLLLELGLLQPLKHHENTTVMRAPTAWSVATAWAPTPRTTRSVVPETR